MTPEEEGMVSGIVEIDESYFGGQKALNKKGGKGIGDKMIVFGMLQRSGRAIVIHVSKKDKETLLPIIQNHINNDSLIYSDGYAVYNDLSIMGYRHVVVTQKPGRRHKKGEWTCGIESLWSYLKGPLLGTHRSMSRKHFQSYLNEFVFRYNMNKRNVDWLEIILERLVS
jgi:transposase